MPPVAPAFATWAGGLRWHGIPDVVRDRLTLRVADAVGLVAAAWDTPAGAAVRDLAAAMSGPPQRPVPPLLFGGPPVTPVWAAFAHGALVHALDYDDTFPTSVVHPTSVLLPAALAAATDHGVDDGAAVLAAVAAGDELLARLGAAAGRDLHGRGFQATSVFGPLAAALVAGTVGGRTPATVASAMGLAGSMSGGLLEFLSDGTWSKRMHPGWAAHGGLVADALAARNFPGPASVVEGRHGVFAAFLARGAGERITDGLGERWESLEAEVKLYPCAHVLHPFITMARQLRDSHRLTPEQVTQVVCGVAPWYVPIVCEPVAEKQAPATEYQARTSLPVAVALALVDDDVRVESFEPASVNRRCVRELARKVRHVPDPGLSHGFGGRLTIHAHGRELAAEPPTDRTGAEERVWDKFVTGTRGRGAAAQALWRAARHLDDHGVARLRRAAAEVARGWGHPG